MHSASLWLYVVPLGEAHISSLWAQCSCQRLLCRMSVPSTIIGVASTTRGSPWRVLRPQGAYASPCDPLAIESRVVKSISDNCLGCKHIHYGSLPQGPSMHVTCIHASHPWTMRPPLKPSWFSNALKQWFARPHPRHDSIKNGLSSFGRWSTCMVASLTKLGHVDIFYYQSGN